MGSTRRIFSQTFDISVYLWASVIYLLITIVFVFLWRRLELRLTRHIHTAKEAEGPIKAKISTCALETENVY